MALELKSLVTLLLCVLVVMVTANLAYVGLHDGGKENLKEKVIYPHIGLLLNSFFAGIMLTVVMFSEIHFGFGILITVVTGAILILFGIILDSSESKFGNGIIAVGMNGIYTVWKFILWCKSIPEVQSPHPGGTNQPTPGGTNQPISEVTNQSIPQVQARTNQSILEVTNQSIQQVQAPEPGGTNQ
jgi:hypothetical protein